jgi:hypothetical protein
MTSVGRACVIILSCIAVTVLLTSAKGSQEGHLMDVQVQRTYSTNLELSKCHAQYLDSITIVRCYCENSLTSTTIISKIRG